MLIRPSQRIQINFNTYMCVLVWVCGCVPVFNALMCANSHLCSTKQPLSALWSYPKLKSVHWVERFALLKQEKSFIRVCLCNSLPALTFRSPETKCPDATPLFLEKVYPHPPSCPLGLEHPTNQCKLGQNHSKLCR